MADGQEVLGNELVLPTARIDGLWLMALELMTTI